MLSYRLSSIKYIIFSVVRLLKARDYAGLSCANQSLKDTSIDIGNGLCTFRMSFPPQYGTIDTHNTQRVVAQMSQRPVTW